MLSLSLVTYKTALPKTSRSDVGSTKNDLQQPNPQWPGFPTPKAPRSRASCSPTQLISQKIPWGVSMRSFPNTSLLAAMFFVSMFLGGFFVGWVDLNIGFQRGQQPPYLPGSQPSKIPPATRRIRLVFHGSMACFINRNLSSRLRIYKSPPKKKLNNLNLPQKKMHLHTESPTSVWQKDPNTSQYSHSPPFHLFTDGPKIVVWDDWKKSLQQFSFLMLNSCSGRKLKAKARSWDISERYLKAYCIIL